MKLCESVDVTGYLACRIAGRGILDEKILGEALSWVEGLYIGIPHYLPYYYYHLSHNRWMDRSHHHCRVVCISD
jgi:hypothetical protein